MSTNVCNAYLYKEDAEIDDIVSCLEYLRGLRGQYDEYIATELANKARDYPDIDWVDDWIVSKTMDMRMQCVVYVCAVEGKNRIVLHFFPYRMAERFLDDIVSPAYSDYSYTDQDDGMFDVPGYMDRGKFYREVYKVSGIPSDAGFSFDIYGGYECDAFRIASMVKKLIKNKVV